MTLLFFLKGLFMGIADIIPGISGGTIAFITGIYERFIKSLSDLSTAGKHFLRLQWKQGWSFVDWRFLVPLTLGITSAFIVGSYTVPTLMKTYPTYVYSFFIGLILASMYIVFGHIKKHNVQGFLFGVGGFLLGIWVATTPTFSTPGSNWFVFVVGILSVSAMMVPGVSGSYVLFMLGQYEHVLSSLHHLNWSVLLSFKAGAIVGLLAFSKVLEFLLEHMRNRMFYALTGIMVGALYRPAADAVALAEPGMLIPSILLLVTGGVIVVVVERIGKKYRA